jgi:hypothetical protein
VRDALRHAYRAEGAAVANAVTDELADVGISASPCSTAFLAVQNDGELDYEELLLTMADALTALAGAVVTRLGCSACTTAEIACRGTAGNPSARRRITRSKAGFSFWG